MNQAKLFSTSLSRPGWRNILILHYRLVSDFLSMAGRLLFLEHHRGHLVFCFCTFFITISNNQIHLCLMLCICIGLKTLLCSKDPVSNRFITKKESDYLRSEIGQLQRDDDLPPIPWKHILTSGPVIALCISQVKDCRSFFYMTNAFLIDTFVADGQWIYVCIDGHGSAEIHEGNFGISDPWYWVLFLGTLIVVLGCYDHFGISQWFSSSQKTLNNSSDSEVTYSFM